LIVVRIKADHDARAAASKHNEGNHYPKENRMVLESVYWENFELAVLVSDNADESILQGKALANESALV
jgi:hypothetical protein